MAYDLAQIVIPTLERAFPVIRRELDQLDLERDFFPWPQRDGYSGIWSVFPLFFPEQPYLPVDVEAHRARCPETSKVLDSLPRLVAGGFSLVGPRSHIFKHTDMYAPHLLRLHLGVRIPPGIEFLVKGKPLPWTEGKCIVFSGQDEHEVINHGDDWRVVLLADFDVQAA